VRNLCRLEQLHHGSLGDASNQRKPSRKTVIAGSSLPSENGGEEPIEFISMRQFWGVLVGSAAKVMSFMTLSLCL
jgi:hypothetical protein